MNPLYTQRLLSSTAVSGPLSARTSPVEANLQDIASAMTGRFHPERSLVAIAVSLCFVLALGACGSSNSGSSPSTASPSADPGTAPGTNPGTTPDSDPGMTPVVGPDPVAGGSSIPVYSGARFDEFSADVDHRYYPLRPGTLSVFEGENDEGESIRVEIAVSHETRMVDGVESVVIIDREFEDDELVEETFDWFAQDTEGFVWYLGEASTEYEDGEAVSTDGSWETGLDIEGIGSVGQGGIVMLANPAVGDAYQHEIYEGIAEDEAQVIALDAPVTLADGSSYTTLQIFETNPLDPESKDEYKFYAPDIGFVREEKLDASESIERTSFTDQKTPTINNELFSNPTVIDNLFQPMAPGMSWRYRSDTEDGVEEILVEVLDETRMVMGIENRVVRDRVFLNGLLIEDTFDWFCQDNAGNVWYFGEIVVNYDYDDNGNVVSTDDDGSWEAGVDSAQPGIQMLAEFRVGDSYRQEYRLEEAEDIAAIVGIDVPVMLDDGASYVTLQTRDWNPLDTEAGDEFKYYAPGVGLIREEALADDEHVDLVSTTMP